MIYMRRSPKPEFLMEFCPTTHFQNSNQYETDSLVQFTRGFRTCMSTNYSSSLTLCPLFFERELNSADFRLLQINISVNTNSQDNEGILSSSSASETTISTSRTPSYLVATFSRPPRHKGRIFQESETHDIKTSKHAIPRAVSITHYSHHIP